MPEPACSGHFMSGRQGDKRDTAADEAEFQRRHAARPGGPGPRRVAAGVGRPEAEAIEASLSRQWPWRAAESESAEPVEPAESAESASGRHAGTPRGSSSETTDSENERETDMIRERWPRRPEQCRQASA